MFLTSKALLFLCTIDLTKVVKLHFQRPPPLFFFYNSSRFGKTPTPPSFETWDNIWTFHNGHTIYDIIVDLSIIQWSIYEKKCSSVPVEEWRRKSLFFVLKNTRAMDILAKRYVYLLNGTSKWQWNGLVSFQHIFLMRTSPCILSISGCRSLVLNLMFLSHLLSKDCHVIDITDLLGYYGFTEIIIYATLSYPSFFKISKGSSVVGAIPSSRTHASRCDQSIRYTLINITVLL